MSAIRETRIGGDGGQAAEESKPEAQSERRSGGATVTMRYMMAAARAVAAGPGVTGGMIKGYDMFASDLGWRRRRKRRRKIR